MTHLQLIKDAMTLDGDITCVMPDVDGDAMLHQYANHTQTIYNMMKLSPQFALRHRPQVELIIAALQEACDEKR